MGRFSWCKEYLDSPVSWCDAAGERERDRSLSASPSTGNISINVMNVTQGRPADQHSHPGHSWCLHPSPLTWSCPPASSTAAPARWWCGARRARRAGTHGRPTPDIIQILSLKTNNQMQSYSPPALSLSYQSSLPEKTSSVFTYIYTSRGISSCSSSTSTSALHPEPQKWSSFLLFVSFISTNL